MSPSSMEFLPFPKEVWAGTKLRSKGAGAPFRLDRELATRPPVGPRPCTTTASYSRAPELRHKEAPKVMCAWTGAPASVTGR